jgi:hypothetical protein
MSLMKQLGRCLVIAVAACAPRTPPVLVPQVQGGPANGARPTRVLVLQASCGSVEYRCPQEFGQTVDSIVRGGLEFAGYSVVGSEQLRAQTRQRHEEHTATSDTSSRGSHTDVEHDLDPFDEHTTTTDHRELRTEHHLIVLDGPDFEDLSVAERHQVLASSGADSVVSVRIVVGGQTGVWRANQHVEVMVKLGVDHGDAMAWASRCMASSNDFSTVSAALENAARCAIHGGTGR